MRSKLEAEIRKYLTKTGYNATDLARLAGVHFTSIYKLLSKKRKGVSLETAEKIQKVLDKKKGKK